MPLKAFQEKLRQIRYYSATRPHDQWSRVMDIALVVALLAAWPTTWVLHHTHVAHRTASTISGKLFEDPDGLIWAWITPPSEPATRGHAVFHGAFRVTVQTEDHGWPFVTAQARLRADTNIELFAEDRSLTAADLPPESPVRTAIERVLVESGRGGAAVALWGGETGVRTAGSSRPRAWVANGIVWSMLLVIAAWLIVSLVRVGALFVAVARLGGLPAAAARTGREERRRRSGQCIACGYDLRGSRYSERCPECGTLSR